MPKAIALTLVVLITLILAPLLGNLLDGTSIASQIHAEGKLSAYPYPYPVWVFLPYIEGGQTIALTPTPVPSPTPTFTPTPTPTPDPYPVSTLP